MGRTLRWTGMLALVLLIPSLTQIPGTLRAAYVLLQSVGLTDPTGLLDQLASPVRHTELELKGDPSTGHTANTGKPPTLRARLYEPTAGTQRTPVVLVHGIHPAGIDEQRLKTLARAMAAVGHPVLTPAIPELASLSATPVTVRRIYESALYLESHANRPVILIGISVGGGLCMLAAAQHPQSTHIARVVTIGAHHDLVRVAQHFAGQTATAPDGTPAPLPPHPYGIQVLAYAHARALFTAEDLALAKRSLKAFLSEEYKAARGILPTLSPAGRRLLTALFNEPTSPVVATPLLAAIGKARPQLRAVSPTKQLSGLTTPVMLLHGATDPIIPATELQWLESEVPSGKLARSLVSEALTHAEFPEDVAAGDYLDLVRFASAMLSAP